MEGVTTTSNHRTSLARVRDPERDLVMLREIIYSELTFRSRGPPREHREGFLFDNLDLERPYGLKRKS
jgi:hypothetical protein